MVEPYIPFSKETNTGTLRTYRRSAGDLPEVIGIRIRRGDAWSHATRMKDVYVPIEAMAMVLDSDILAAAGKVAERVRKAVSKAKATA